MDLYNRLKTRIHDQAKGGGTLVAFSGGVDSTLLLKAALDALSGNVLAVTAHSALHPDREMKIAASLTEKMGIEHLVVHSQEMDILKFRANQQNRCYLCKKELFTTFREIAGKRSISLVLEGSNSDDQNDYRPGMKAVKELGIGSPFLDMGITKEQIRSMARKLDISVWDKPSFACLASRIPYGQEITSERLKRIEAAEDILLAHGFTQVRARDHHPVLRIEVLPEQIEFFAQKINREKIVQKLRKIGYPYLSLDLEGFRSGSMNIELSGGY